MASDSGVNLKVFVCACQLKGGIVLHADRMVRGSTQLQVHDTLRAGVWDR